MLYIYSQEERDQLLADQGAIEKRVKARVDEELKLARKRAAKVIEDFFMAYRHEMTRNFAPGALISYPVLKEFSDALHKANHTEEKCDKPAASVIQ